MIAMLDCVQLPGGVLIDGVIHRLVQFKPITGKVEFSITSPANQYLNRPAWVSAVLATAVKRIGMVEMTMALANRLSYGDRVFLMLAVGIRYDRDQMWLSPICDSCGDKFDVSVKRSEIPVVEAGQDYPFAQLKIRSSDVSLRAVNGEDQLWLNEHLPADFLKALLSRCIQTVNGKPATPEFVNGLVTEDCSQLETAIHCMGPDVDCSITVKCPECGNIQEVETDPYWVGQNSRDELDEDIHRLAYHYHWSETEILNLTRDRRRSFLRLIDKECGRHV